MQHSPVTPAMPMMMLLMTPAEKEESDGLSSFDDEVDDEEDDGEVNEDAAERSRDPSGRACSPGLLVLLLLFFVCDGGEKHLAQHSCDRDRLAVRVAMPW